MRAVGYGESGEAARFELTTAGAPDHLEILPDRMLLAADGSSLSHLEIRVVDAAGRRVVSASPKIAIQASGAGELAAMDLADPAM